MQELAEKSDRDLISSQELRSPDPANREQSAALYNEQGCTELVEYEAHLEEQEGQDASKREESLGNQGVVSMQTDALQQKLEVNIDDYDDNGEEEEPIQNQGKNTDEGDNNEEVQCNDARSRHDGSSPVLEGVSNSRSAGDISQQDNKSKTGVDLHQDAGSSEDWQKSDDDIEKVETHPHAIVQKCIKRSRHKTTRYMFFC